MDYTPHRIWFDVVQVLKRTDKKWDLVVRAEDDREVFVWLMRKHVSLVSEKDPDTGEVTCQVGLPDWLARKSGLLESEAMNG